MPMERSRDVVEVKKRGSQRRGRSQDTLEDRKEKTSVDKNKKVVEEKNEAIPAVKKEKVIQMVAPTERFKSQI